MQAHASTAYTRAWKRGLISCSLDDHSTFWSGVSEQQLLFESSQSKTICFRPEKALSARQATTVAPGTERAAFGLARAGPSFAASRRGGVISGGTWS